MDDAFGEPRSREFHNRVEGTWGEFHTPAGRVAYLMTNARLGETGTDWERRLTSRLRPVREVLPVDTMTFGQLLQRDLDDHRVASDLVPYLLNQNATGPAFFPPILAVLLPFDGGAAGSFPPAVQSVVEDGFRFLQDEYGDSFQARRMVERTTDNLHQVRFGQLAWNDERAQVVVLDGQHRAMALLAIDRTVNGNWQNSARGMRYRAFYEDRVRAALGPSGKISADIQVPVTVCWFPDLTDSLEAPHRAARKLFVDVNREARKPSEDRVVLLSDDDLLNVLTRKMLDVLKVDSAGVPLFAIEYDNPSERASVRPTRWSSISTLQALKHMVDACVFGPAAVVRDVSKKGHNPRSGSRASRADFMRKQLRVVRIFPHVIADGSGVLEREELSEDNFPHEQLDVLLDEFQAGWGSALLELLGEVRPFAAHHQALRALHLNWTPSDPSAADTLAKEAIFEGMGMYWTLRDAYQEWAAPKPSGRRPLSDVEKAFLRVLDKEKEFRSLRAKALLQTSGDQTERDAEAAFAVFQTQACQVGIAMLLATLAYRTETHGPAVAVLARHLREALNLALDGPAANEQPLVLVFSQHASVPLNRITAMNTPRWAEFRYLWLEVLCSERAINDFLAKVPSLEQADLLALRDRARSRFMWQMTDERIREARRDNPRLQREVAQALVVGQVLAGMEAALAAWFGVEQPAFLEWTRTVLPDAYDEEEQDDGNAIDDDEPFEEDLELDEETLSGD